MPRPLRLDPGDLCYHVINRGNGRATVFHKPDDFAAFERILALGCDLVDMRVLAWCLMPNHFHLVLWPRKKGVLSRFMQWVTTCHVRRYHRHYHGSGHVWQGRYRAFVAQNGAHLLTVLRYVERNPVRAGLATRAEEWPWASARFAVAPGLAGLRSGSEGSDTQGSGSFLGGSMPKKVPDPLGEVGPDADDAFDTGSEADDAFDAGLDSDDAFDGDARGSGTFSRIQPREKEPDPGPREIEPDPEAAPRLPLQAYLAAGPVRRPRPWLAFVNQLEDAAELQRLRAAVNRGTPFGQPAWQQATAKKLGLESTLRPRGRPAK